MSRASAVLHRWIIKQLSRYEELIIDDLGYVQQSREEMEVLMAELLRRIDLDKTRLILVGDHNQLPPVGAGNVLRDCIKYKLVPTFVLDEVVRQAGVLKTNSMAILSQRAMPTVGDRRGLGNAVKKNNVSQRRTFLDRWTKANLESWEVLL